MTRNTKAAHGGLHVVALFEALKGFLVLVTGFGLLAFIHRDLHEAAIQLVRLFHLNPASHYPLIFLDLTEHINNTRLWALAMASMLYALVRFVEAVGLWLQRQWAEWFGVLTGGIYIPIEIYELLNGVTWPKLTIFLVNTVVVVYLLLILLRNGKK